MKLAGVSEARGTESVGEGGGGASAENAGAEGEVDFVHEVFAEEGIVEFAAAFAEEAADAPVVVEVAEGAGEVDSALAADFYGVGPGTEGAEADGAGSAGGEDDNGGERGAEEGGVEVDVAGAGDDYPEIELGKAGAEAAALVAGTAGTELDVGLGVNGAGAGHDGVGGGAQGVEAGVVGGAAEGVNGTVGVGDFGVGGGGHVDEDEGVGGHG